MVPGPLDDELHLHLAAGVEEARDQVVTVVALVEAPLGGGAPGPGRLLASFGERL